MQKSTTDDIGAICSRIDAQTVIMIELLTAINNKQVISNIISSPGVYTKRYDELAKKFREEMVG